DHPLISATLIDDLITQFYALQMGLQPAEQAVAQGVLQMKIVLPVFRGQRGHPVIFSAALYEELLAAPLDKGARAVVWAHAGEIAEVPTAEQGCVLNLNDPDTLQRA